MNHRKKTKADGSRLIPRKHTETLVLLSERFSYTQITALDIGRNFFGDGGARLLCRCIDKVRTLGLGDCRISEEGIKRMAQAMRSLETPVQI